MSIADWDGDGYTSNKGPPLPFLLPEHNKGVDIMSTYPGVESVKVSSFIYIILYTFVRVICMTFCFNSYIGVRRQGSGASPDSLRFVVDTAVRALRMRVRGAHDHA